MFLCLIKTFIIAKAEKIVIKECLWFRRYILNLDFLLVLIKIFASVTQLAHTFK